MNQQSQDTVAEPQVGYVGNNSWPPGHKLMARTAIAWDAYRTAVGGRAMNGDPLPTWEEMVADPNKKTVVTAWLLAVKAVVTDVRLSLANELTIRPATGAEIEESAAVVFRNE